MHRRSRPAQLVGLSVLIAALGCERSAPVAPLGHVGPSAVATLFGTARGAIRTIDDDFADLSDAIPGFGGLFYDETGRLTVYMKVPADLANHKADLTKFLENLKRGDPAAPARIPSEISSAKILTGKYSFRELLTLYRSTLHENLPYIPALASTDIDEVRNLIVVGVRDDASASVARERLASVGLTSGVALVEVVPASVPNSLLADSLRPLPGGARIQLYNPNAGTLTPCTLGFNLVRYELYRVWWTVS